MPPTGSTGETLAGGYGQWVIDLDRGWPAERLDLEPLAVAHAAELAPLLDDAALHEFTGDAPLSAAALAARYARLATRRSLGGGQLWGNRVIRVRATGAAAGTVQATLPAARRARLLEGKVGIMSKPALAVLAAVALAVLAGCSGGATSVHPNARSTVPPSVSVCGFLKSGGLVATVNRPGAVTSGESVTLEASNPGPAVRLDIATLTVGGGEGVSGNIAGPDTITVGRTFTIPARTAELTALATFPVSDPGLEDVPGPGVLEAVDDVSLASGC